MSEARVEIAARASWEAQSAFCDWLGSWEELPQPQQAEHIAIARSVIEALDAVSSQYEQVGWCWPNPMFPGLHFFMADDGGEPPPRDGICPCMAPIEYSADTRALIANRTPAETAEVKAWSDAAHARIRAGEVSGSHDLMRAKVSEYHANTQEGT